MIGLSVLVLMLGAESVLGTFQWSPYYKIHSQDLAGGLVRIEVNNTPLQTALPVEVIRRSSPFYLYPYTYAASVTTCSSSERGRATTWPWRSRRARGESMPSRSTRPDADRPRPSPRRPYSDPG